VELDVVAESLDKRHILNGECKWTSGENGRLLTNEIQKVTEALPFAKDKRIEFVLFMKVKPVEDVGNAILPQTVFLSKKSKINLSNFRASLLKYFQFLCVKLSTLFE